MKAAAAEDPSMDLSRVGIYGGSAGGQNALRALLAHGDFYDAAVADCGCHDNRMDKIWWNEAWMGWPIGPHYAEQSNITQAHRLTGKLLLIVGEVDRNVDPASTMKVVSALIQADKDFDLLVMPGTGHGAAESPYGRHRRADFYDAAVADCGCHDNRMDKIWWNEAWMGWPIGPHYKEQSNITQAHRLVGKLLLIVGEVDRNVDPASTMKVVDALIKADKDFDLLVIPGAGHGAAGTKYGQRRQADFFVRHLLGVEPRAK